MTDRSTAPSGQGSPGGDDATISQPHREHSCGLPAASCWPSRTLATPGRHVTIYGFGWAHTGPQYLQLYERLIPLDCHVERREITIDSRRPRGLHGDEAVGRLSSFIFKKSLATVPHLSLGRKGESLQLDMKILAWISEVVGSYPLKITTTSTRGTYGQLSAPL